jgi:hypothetical protein
MGGTTSAHSFPREQFKQPCHSVMKFLSIIFSSILLSACAADIMVYSDRDPAYDLSNFGTFDWAEKTDVENGKNPLYYSDLNDRRIKAAVEKELFSRGYTRTTKNADRVIHYHIVVEEESVLAPEPYGYFYGPYWMRARLHVHTYREGTLIIDMLDPQTKNLVWRSWATAALDMITENEVEPIIYRAVAKMFKEFPHSSQSIPAVVDASKDPEDRD